MDDLALIADLHRGNPRQGPGGEQEALRALELADLDGTRKLQVADIGAGTGAGTLLLARELGAQVTAVDFLPEFLEEIQRRSNKAGLQAQIQTLQASMDQLPLAQNEFDLIWSEGAVYNMGFARGVKYWRQFLRPGGVLAVSEITWLTASRPRELQTFWQDAYPEIDTASKKIEVLENCGYSPCGYFTLGAHCWQENYYYPLRDNNDEFMARHGNSESAAAIVAEGNREQALYEQYGDYYSYGFYVAKRSD